MKHKKQFVIILCIAVICIIIGIAVVKKSSSNKEEEIKELEETQQLEGAETVEDLVIQTSEDEMSFTKSDSSYFDDVLFVGDSRTAGLYRSGYLNNADYFAVDGMTVYRLWEEALEVEGVGLTTLDQLLELKDYQKVYIMLGINSLGFDKDETFEKYKETVLKIQESQDEAIIYLCANLHVTQRYSNTNEIVNNDNLNVFNDKVKELASQQKLFYYIDINEQFDDENGNLRSECTGDGIHIHDEYYEEWTEWLCNNTIQIVEISEN